jgi:hypothetical protein
VSTGVRIATPDEARAIAEIHVPQAFAAEFVDGPLDNPKMTERS